MNDFNLHLKAGVGPYRVTSLNDAAVDIPAISTELAFGVGYQPDWLQLRKTISLGFQGDLTFTSLTTTEQQNHFQRFEELLRFGIRLRFIDLIALDTLVGIGPAQNLPPGDPEGSFNVQVQALLGLEFCLPNRTCITPFAAVTKGLSVSGLEQEDLGLLFGVRIGGNPGEEEEDSLAIPVAPPPTVPILAPTRPSSPPPIAPTIPSVPPTTAALPFGPPDRYATTLVQQRAAVVEDLRRYVTLYFLAGFTGFQMRYLETLPADPLATAAWRTHPDLFLEGMEAFLTTARVDRDPAHHPESEETNALLCFADLLQLTRAHTERHEEIPGDEFDLIITRFRPAANTLYRGTITGMNLYLLFCAVTRSTTLPSEALLKAMQAMGCRNLYVDRVRALKRALTGGAP